MFTQFKIDWMSNIRGDLLSGIVVALALIPEAIAFSLIAGVDLRSVCTPHSASALSLPLAVLGQG